MKNYYNFLLLLLLACAIPLLAQDDYQDSEESQDIQEAQDVQTSDAISQTDVSDQNKMSDPNLVEADVETIDDWAESVRESFGLSDWGEYNGKFFAFGSQQAASKVLDPNFGASLAVAFDQAMMNARAEIVMVRFGKEFTNSYKEYFRNGSTDAREITVDQEDSSRPANKFLRVLDKSLDVEEAELDQKLIALGIDPGEIEKTPLVKKKILFKDRFVKNIMKKASGEAYGIFPLQTTVKFDEKNNAIVGVVVVFSDKTCQIAKDIAAQRRSIIKGKGIDLASMKPTDKNPLGDFGVRLVYDLDGTPAIVSYGIAPYIPDGDDDYINSDIKRDAKQAAMDQADAQIAEVVNGYMSIENQRQNGEEVERFVEREMTADSMTMEKDVKKIINIVNRRAKTSASMKMQGITTLYQKLFKIPQGGHQFYLVIRVWKFSSVKAIQNLGHKDTTRQQQSGEAATPSKPASYDGRKFNTLEDF